MPREAKLCKSGAFDVRLGRASRPNFARVSDGDEKTNTVRMFRKRANFLACSTVLVALAEWI